MTLKEAIRRLPKTDLHCHLDGSLRLETMYEIARQRKLDVGSDTPDELRSRLRLGQPVESLEAFIDNFRLTCSVMQWRETLERIAFELVEDAALENVRYLEVRFAPNLHTAQGLSHDQVIEAVYRGLQKGESRHSVRTGIIICALRNFDPRLSKELAEIAVQWRNNGVVGFDLANPEKGNPALRHAEAARFARQAGIHVTIHAGEDDGPESIRQALDLCQAERIGHGRTLREDRALEARVIESNIPLEICPSSNVQIGFVPTYRDHPLAYYLEAGVQVTLNTDNRLLTDISVTDEYLRMAEALDWTWQDVVRIARNGFAAAFLAPSERAEITAAVEAEISTIEQQM